ncbi:hypothetical protein FJZ48_01190 [Candidatus Uhrbacteria bacterium]|nr:hypothetical protein [Candidatus Uhrbacteria bacterium]
MFEYFSKFLNWLQGGVDVFLNLAGNDPFSAMWFLFLHGGWIAVAWALGWGALYYWQFNRQGKFGAKREWILLRVAVPKVSEQTPKAVENMMAYFAGAHQSNSWTDTWIRGVSQAPISLEIASLGGQVSYFIYSERKMRDLVEAAIYAQYPDAEIQEVEDYAKKVPSHYPDEEWDAWGVEMINVIADSYPLKTYHDLVDPISGEFKDNLAAMLEGFSRLSADEQAWYQIVITPTDQKAAKARAEKLINKLKGIKEEHKESILELLVDIPLNIGKTFIHVLLGTAEEAPHKEEKKDLFPKLFALSPMEKEVLEGVERKAQRINFQTKIRFMYIAKKTVMQKSRVANPFVGSIKQTNNMFSSQSLKPETNVVGNSGALWFFKDLRNNIRKHHLITAYRARSNWAGWPSYTLSTEELATLWHFPILMQVKAPQLSRTEAKKNEAPANIPFG